MADKTGKGQAISGIDSKDALRTLTRVTEGHLKRTGTNPAPETAKPMNFSPPGQGTPAPGGSESGQSGSNSTSGGDKAG